MHVTMTYKIGGTRDGVEWPEVGESIELPDHEATDLIAAGMAKESDGTTPEPVEAAPEPDVEEPAAPDDAEPAGDPQE